MKFTDFQFSQKVLQGIQDAGFVECTPVQDRVFAAALENRRDVAVRSQTGTGKTAAFLLSIFEIMEEEPNQGHKALIVAPTRELAVQIEEEAKLLGKHLSINIASFYGGVGYGLQEKNIKEGVDIIIGTPGRLLDFAQSRKLDFSQVDMVVIDEADRLFDMGFFPDLKKMLKRMVKPAERQTMLFSATLNTRVERLAWEFMNNPEEIIIESQNITVEEITQKLYHVAKEEKMKLLLRIFETERPANVLIFTNTKDMAVKVAKRLIMNGYHAEYIMGDLPQKKRLDIIERVKDGKVEILVATDVAARGLHIDDLEMVVNFDIPEDPENYVHRIGRTARAGKSGKAVSLACDKYVFGLEPIEDLIGMKIPLEHPDEDFLDVEDKSEGARIIGTHSQKFGKGGPSRRSGPPRTPHKGRRKPSGPSGGGKERKPAPQTGPAGGGRKLSGGPKSAPRPASDNRKRVDGGQSAADKKPAVSGSPKRAADIDSRLEYYRRKYGEDFEVKAAGSSGKSGGRKGNAPGGSKDSPGSASPQKASPEKTAPGKKKSRGLLGKLFSGENKPN